MCAAAEERIRLSTVVLSRHSTQGLSTSRPQTYPPERRRGSWVRRAQVSNALGHGLVVLLQQSTEFALKVEIIWGQLFAGTGNVERSSGSEETNMTSAGAVFQSNTKADIRHFQPIVKWQSRSDPLEKDDPGGLDYGLSGPQVIGRVLFSCASTLLIALSIYLAIRWMAGA